jgi:tetratricopeptide (TPR) repeat protein
MKMKKNFLIFSGLLITGQVCLSQLNRPFRISLLSENNSSLTVYHDEPVIFSVTLTNPEARFAREWNLASDRDMAELNEKLKTDTSGREKYLSEIERLRSGKKEIISFSIGSKQEPWFKMIKWEILKLASGAGLTSQPQFLLYQQMDSVAILGAGAYYKVYFGISETEIQNWNAGKYQVRAICGQMISEPVELIIRAEKIPAAMAESVPVLFKKGRYEWLNDNPDKAIQASAKILEKNPKQPDALAFRGEIFVQKKNYAAALKDFQDALQLYKEKQPGQFEPPEYLLGMIAWLKEQK